MLENLTLDSPSYNPLIDKLFKSSTALADEIEVLAILLTGIGEDGARGLLALKEAGHHTIAESETSAIVYGMPRTAKELGAACEILELDRIIRAILRFVKSDV